MKSIVSKYVICLFVMVVLSNRIYGATRYWDNGGVDNNWSNPINWTSDTPPVTGDTVKLENSAPDEAQIINLDTDVSLSAIQCSATGDRNYTIETSNNSKITITGTYDVDASTMKVDLIFDVDILVSGVEIRFYRSPNGTIIVNGEIGNIGGTHEISGNYSGFLTLAGSNTASKVQNNGDGEILAKHAHALGDGTYRNGGIGATLALATDVTIYNYLQVTSPMNLLIKDAGASDVTLTVEGGCVEGLVAVLPNSGGSTGNLTIEAKNNQQSEWILTTNSTIVFARESGVALWGHANPGYGGWISGGGSVLIDCPDGVSCYITNDFTGGIIITNGSLNINGNDYLPTNGAVTVLSGATLRLVGSATQTLGAIKGNGTVNLDNSDLTVKTALEPGASDAGSHQQWHIYSSVRLRICF